MSNPGSDSSSSGGRGGWWSRMSRSEQIVAAVVGPIVAGAVAVVVALIHGSPHGVAPGVGPSPSAPPTSVSPSFSSASPTSALPAPTGRLATQIRLDGVYVIGTDIPDGTWHTSGGSSCYEATLNSPNTNDIRYNNNFTGPDTVDLTGAYAFKISGGCTWQQISNS